MSRLAMAIAAAAAATIATTAALPMLSDADSSGARDITVREKVRAVSFVRAKKSTKGDQLAMGDRVITRQGLFDEQNHAVGTFFTDCVNVGHRAQVFSATLQCTSIYRFGDGQVVSSGVVRLGGDPAQIRIAIVGGTGAYASGRGEVGSGDPVKGYDTVDVLHVAG